MKGPDPSLKLPYRVAQTPRNEPDVNCPSLPCSHFRLRESNLPGMWCSWMSQVGRFHELSLFRLHAQTIWPCSTWTGLTDSAMCYLNPTCPNTWQHHEFVFQYHVQPDRECYPFRRATEPSHAQEIKRSSAQQSAKAVHLHRLHSAPSLGFLSTNLTFVVWAIQDDQLENQHP